MKFKFEFGDLFKIPNILCYVRIILVPMFAYVYLTADTQQDFFMAAGIVLVSGITDFLDGQIARRCNMITDLGKIIDPVADKLMQFIMLVCLTIKVRYMAVLVGYLVIKEITMFVAGAIVYKRFHKRLNGAKWYGKVCTAILYLLMLIFIASPNLNIYIRTVMMIICIGALSLAFVMYIRLYVIMAKDTKNEKDNCTLY